MRKTLSTLLLCICLPVFSVQAQEDLVRLPGQGEVKPDTAYIEGLGQLVPGGGLLLSFDDDRNGEITQQELADGIAQAFLDADANDDGRITPIEQLNWSNGLPTRDVSLANPARFDPNLDRSVRPQEFKDIVIALASIYTEETTGTVPVQGLKATKNRTAVKDGLAESEKQEKPRQAQRPTRRASGGGS